MFVHTDTKRACNNDFWDWFVAYHDLTAAKPSKNQVSQNPPHNGLRNFAELGFDTVAVHETVVLCTAAQ